MEDDVGRAGGVPLRVPGVPAAEVLIDEGLVAGLIGDQFPDMGGLPLRRAAEGWDNLTYRLGDELAVRLPRRLLAVECIEREQRWLDELAVRLPLPVPVPAGIGRPGRGYPWPWSIVPWFPGADATIARIGSDQAPVMGRFLAALHHPAPPDAPHNPFRSLPLPECDARLAQRLEGLEALDHGLGFPIERVRAVWHEVKGETRDAETWIHGDLHPRNVIVADGAIVAVTDWGDVASGDPATDLATAWMHFPLEAHSSFRIAYGPATDATWARARGWALVFGAMFLEAALHDGDAAFAAVGRVTLQRAVTG